MSTNVFTSVLTDLNGVEERLFGQQYDYVKNIRTPAELGMSASGSRIANNISGLINYVKLLVSGNSPASANRGKPLGNKYFLKVGGTCLDKATQKQVERSIYINNVPDGDIPFISSGLGVNFTSFKGLIPGTISNANRIRPMQIMQSFFAGDNQECQAVTLETIDNNNTSINKTEYLTTIDIQNMSPCWFLNKENPITKQRCRETFSNLINAYSDYEPYYDEYNKLYLTISSIFILYLIIKITQNRLK